MARPRILVIVIAAIAAAIALVVRPAQAQQSFLSQSALQGDQVAMPLVAGGFQLDPQVFVTEFSAYLDGMEQLAARMADEERKFRERVKIYNRAFMSLRDTERLQEINAKGESEHIALLAALVDRLKTHVPADQAERMELLKPSLEVRVLSHHYYALFDISKLATFRVPGTPQQRKACWAATTARAAERAHAIRALKEVIWAGVRASAANAETAGVIGLDWNAIRDEWRKMLEDQARLANAPDENRAALAAIDARLAAIRELREPEPTLVPEWWELSRVELAALDDVRQLCGPAVFAPRLHAWYAALAGGHKVALPVVPPEGNAYVDVSEFARDVLRLRLTDEQRTKVRELCRTLVDGVRERQRSALDKCVSQKQFFPDAFDHRAWIDDQLAAIGQALGDANLTASPGDQGRRVFPRGELSPRASDVDAALYGQVQDAFDITIESKRAHARWNLIPAPYSVDLTRTLRTLLRVGDAQMPVVEALVRDAHACVERARVEPTDEAPDLDPQVRAAAFVAAIACDRDLVASLEAAIGERMDRSALATIAASWRTGEPAASGGLGLVGDVDIPRAILEVPISDESRRVLCAEFAPAAAQWTQMAADYLRARIAVRSVQDRWSFLPGETEQAVEQREVLAEYNRVRAQWTAAARDMAERLAARLSPAESELWRAHLRRMQWPDFYEHWDNLVIEVDAAIGDGPDAAAIRAAVAPLMDRARQAMQRTGDAAVAAALAVAPVEELRATDRPEWPHDTLAVAARNASHAFRSIGRWRDELARESIRHALPPERAMRISGHALFPVALELPMSKSPITYQDELRAASEHVSPPK